MSNWRARRRLRSRPAQVQGHWPVSMAPREAVQVARRVGVAKQHALAGQPVEGGCPDHGVAQATGMRIHPVVGQQIEDVWPRRLIIGRTRDRNRQAAQCCRGEPEPAVSTSW